LDDEGSVGACHRRQLNTRRPQEATLIDLSPNHWLRPVSETLTWHIVRQQRFDMSVTKSEVGMTVVAGGRVVAFRQMVTVIGAAVSCFLFSEHDSENQERLLQPGLATKHHCMRNCSLDDTCPTGMCKLVRS